MTPASSQPPDAAAFTLRRRPASEKLLDQGFHYLTLALASFVGILLLAIVLTVFQGAREAIATFGARFITTSSWDPVNNEYGAFVAIYGTLVTSLLSLVVQRVLKAFVWVLPHSLALTLFWYMMQRARWHLAI